MQYLAVPRSDKAAQSFITGKISGAGGTLFLHELRRVFQLRFNYQIDVVNGGHHAGLTQNTHVFYPVDAQEKVHLPEQ